MGTTNTKSLGETMTTKTDVISAITSLSTQLDTMVEKGIEWIQGDEDLTNFKATIVTPDTGLIDLFKGLRTKVNDYQVDSSFKSINSTDKRNILTSSWSIMERIHSVQLGTEEIEAVIEELDDEVMFTSLNTILQKAINKFFWPLVKRIEGQTWRLDKLKNTLERIT